MATARHIKALAKPSLVPATTVCGLLDPLSETTVQPFADWLDDQLARLEQSFHHLCTPQTITDAIGPRESR